MYFEKEDRPSQCNLKEPEHYQNEMKQKRENPPPVFGASRIGISKT